MDPNFEFRSDNHYLPKLYLKRFETSDGRIYASSLLVSHSNVPEWKLRSLKAVAYRTYLYSRVVSGSLTDQVERWFCDEIETPAEGPIAKATEGRQMSKEDWRILIRFLAAQDLRTPARLADFLKNYQTLVPEALSSTIADAKRRVREVIDRGERPVFNQSVVGDSAFPMRLVKEVNPESGDVAIKVEVLAGRGLWHHSMQHLLKNCLQGLFSHRWTILLAPEGVAWLTSDDPVVKTNYRSLTDYDFDGGWGTVGTQIFLPLSPRHLLYTHIGNRVPERGTVLSRDQANTIRFLIVQHAYRTVLASTKDPDVAEMRPRLVDLKAYQEEIAIWSRWHDEQSAAEKKMQPSPQLRPA